MNYFVFDEMGLGCGCTPLPELACPSPTDEVWVKKSIDCSAQKHLPRSLCFFVINEKHYQWNVKQDATFGCNNYLIFKSSPVLYSASSL